MAATQRAARTRSARGMTMSGGGAAAARGNHGRARSVARAARNHAVRWAMPAARCGCGRGAVGWWCGVVVAAAYRWWRWWSRQQREQVVG